MCLLSRELKKDVPSRGMLHYLCCCCTRYPDALVTVHLDSASGLAKQDFVGEGVYVIDYHTCTWEYPNFPTCGNFEIKEALQNILYKQKYWPTLHLVVCSENAVDRILNWRF